MGEPLRILLVEDSVDDALLLLREIKNGGYEITVVRVETAEEMTTYLNEQTWDIVISDYSLPKFNAPEALKILQDSGLDLPFIIVSGKVADDGAVDVLTAGAHDFVRKDNMVRLIPAIKRQLDEAIGRAEHIKAEIALEESEEKYSSLFKNNYSVMLLIDPQTGNIVDANPSACDFYGYSLTELTQKNIYDINNLSAEEVQQEVNSAKLEQRNHFFFRHRLASGEIRDVEVYSAPITVQGKSLLHSIIHDITKRKQAEEALQKNEDKYRSLFESMVQGVFYQSANGIMTDVNQAALNMLGLTRDQFLGRDSYDPAWNVISEDGSYLPPDKYPSRIALNTGKDVKDAVVGVFNPNINEYNWLTINAKPQFRDDEKSPYQLFVTLHDITKHKRAEGILRLHSEMLENMGEGVYLIRTSDGIIVHANPRFEEMFGYEHDEMIGQHVSTVNAPTDISPEETVRVLMKILLEEGVWHGDIHNIKKDGTLFWCHANVSVFEHSEYGQVLVAVHEDITERKQAEDNLRESKQFIESIVNIIPEIVYIYDIIEQKNVYSNDGIQKVLGYSIDKIQEMGNQVVSTLMHPDDFKIYLEETYPAYSKAKDDEIISHQFRMKHKNGQWHWLDCSEIVYMRQPDGIPKQILGVIHDITERKHSEEALARYTDELELNKKRLDVLLQLTSMADNSLEDISKFVLDEGAKLTDSKFGFIGLMNEDDTILINSAWTNNVMDVCSVIDKPLKFIVDGAGIWIEPLLQRKSVIINDYESTELNKNGVPDGHIPLKRLIIIPIFEGDKVVTLVTMANKEDEYDEKDVLQLTLLLEGMWSIIQRKRAEDEKDALIHKVSERTKELGVLYDISKLAAQTEMTLEEIMELAITFIPNGWQYPEITCARIILNDNEYTTANFAKTMWGQIAPIRISGELIGSVEVYYLEDMPKLDEGPFYHEERNLLNTVAHHLGSIAERKRAEDEIQRFNSELEQRVKDRTVELEETNKELVRLDRVKSEFMDTVNHELRTPLTSIIGYSKLLLDGMQGKMSEKHTQYVERIWTRGNHQLQLVNDLLDFSKLESGNMDFMSKLVPVTTAIDEVVSDEMPLLKEKGQEIIIEIADSVADVYVDEMRLKQVMLNIVNNAIKFTPDNGTIVIKADNVDEMVKISVIDDGIGIKESDIGKLFQKFVQVDQSNSRSFGGTGLGLTIAKDLVELMGGHIDVESEYGKGSTFSIFLPQRDSEKHNAAS